MLYQLSYEATHWERGQFVEFKKKPEKKNQGFNGIQTRDLRDTGAMLYQLSYEVTHWASSFQLLKLENLLRRSFFTLIYHRSSHMNYFIYASRQFFNPFSAKGFPFDE